jgi:rubrerythrin
MVLDLDFSKLDAMDALDLAVFVEAEAAEAYEQLAGFMDAQGEGDAADFFRRMIRLERLHGEQVAALRRELFGDTPARYTHNIAWEVEVPDVDSLGATVDLRRAYEIALGAETRAHDFYAGAVEYARNDKVEELLDGLRKAELEHQRILREEMAKL